MLQRFVSLKERRAKTSKVSSEDSLLKNKELIFTKLKNEYEAAISKQREGELDSALIMYGSLVEELKRLADDVKNTREIDDKIRSLSFQQLPFEFRLHFLCLKNSAYICEEKGRWEEMKSLYSILMDSFADWVVLDTGLVVRMLRALKKVGSFSFARKICEYYLRQKNDKFIYTEWCSLIRIIGDSLIYESQDNADDMSWSNLASSSSFIQSTISFEATIPCKSMKPAYFITDARNLLLWILLGAFYDSESVSFDFQSHVQLVHSYESPGILDSSGSVIFSEKDLMEKMEYIYQIWKDASSILKPKNFGENTETYGLEAVWNELKISSQRAGLDTMIVDCFALEEHSLNNQTNEMPSNIFHQERFSQVLLSFPDWDKLELPSYSCSLFDLFCLLLTNFANCSNLPIELGPLLCFAWLQFRSIFPTISTEENILFLNVAELIFKWFPFICRILNLSSSTLSPMSDSYEDCKFIPCSFCNLALMECEYLLTRFLDGVSEQEETFEEDLYTKCRVFILKAKINSYLCRQDSNVLLHMNLDNLLNSVSDIERVAVSFNQFSMKLLDTLNLLMEQRRLIDHLMEFYSILWQVNTVNEWEIQLVRFCHKLRPQLFTNLTEERLHEHLLLCDFLDIGIHAPLPYQTDYSLLTCITFKLQIVSSFLTVVSSSFKYAGCTMIMIQQQISKSFLILKKLSSFLKDLEAKQNDYSTCNNFLPEMIDNLLLLFESLCLLAMSLVEMRHRDESLEWLVKSTSKYQKRLMFLLLCISKTCEWLLSTWESLIIQSWDDSIADLMEHSLALFYIVLRQISLRENLQRMKSFRSIIQVYCTCLRRWMNVCNAGDKEPFLILKEWNQDSNSFIERRQHISSELAAGYYYRYGLRAPFISDDDLNGHWLTRELSLQSFIKSLDPTHVVEFYYAFQKELREATISNRKGSIGEMKRTLKALLKVFFSVEQPAFEPNQLIEPFKSSLENVTEEQLEDESTDWEFIFASSLNCWISRGQRLLEHLHFTKRRSSVDLHEYHEVLLDICDLLSRCLSLELEMTRKKVKSMSLTSYFVSRHKLLEEFLGLQLFILSLEPKRAQCWLWLGEMSLELSHVDNEMKHLEIDENRDSNCIYLRFEECAKVFSFSRRLASYQDHLNGRKVLMQLASQGEGICYFLAARLAKSSKFRFWHLAIRALDRLIQMKDTEPDNDTESVSLIHHNSLSWWYFFLLRGKLGFKLRESVERICWFLTRAIVLHREEATRLRQELETEPIYQFDMIRLKILLHEGEFSLCDDSLKILLDDSDIYFPISDDRKKTDSSSGACINFDISSMLRIVSNQIVEHVNYIWDSHQFRNGSRSSGYLYKPFYAQAVAYKVGLQMNQKALDSISNLFQPSVANSSIGNFWYMFTALPWKFKCLSFYIQQSALLKQKENLWAAFSRLKRRKPEETDDELLKQVMQLYFDCILSTSSEWKYWDNSRLSEELQHLWKMYLFLTSFYKESSLINAIQRKMESLLCLVCPEDENSGKVSLLAYCSKKWPELERNLKRKRGFT
ncbi:Uncharacterized protein Gasu2_24420 [Galdieria sulphuraria]|nr:Uncharacterized protein Gasu2_24420 [Galdieria sulphuraria]